MKTQNEEAVRLVMELRRAGAMKVKIGDVEVTWLEPVVPEVTTVDKGVDRIPGIEPLLRDVKDERQRRELEELMESMP